MIRLEVDGKIIFVADEKDLDELDKKCAVLVAGGLDKESAIYEVLGV